MILPAFTAFALPGIPIVQPDDDLVALIQSAMKRAEMDWQDDDVLVISSKIVSKAAGRTVDLTTVTPSETAHDLSQKTGKDPRLVELVLRESTAVSRYTRGVLVTVHRLGFVSANSGIDQSNVTEDDDQVLLLPEDPDTTARQIQQQLQTITGKSLAVVISDTHGRPFRLGNTGVAIGVAGLPALVDLRGKPDLNGRELEITSQGYADLIASAAHLLCGEADEGLPVIVLRGLVLPPGNSPASTLNRPPEQDLYR